MAFVASPIIVSGSDSLGANFADNAQRVLCDSAFAAGTYGIFGAITGAAKLTPAGRLATGASLLAALAFCPSGASQQGIFGAPPFDGGQCDVTYRIRYRHTQRNPPIFPGDDDIVVRGPINSLAIEQYQALGAQRWGVMVGVRGTAPELQRFPWPVDEYFFEFGSISRIDNLPDNCGNPPLTGGQIITNIDNSNTVNGDTIIDNSDNKTIVPIIINLGGVNGTLNLSFGDIKIGSLMPFQFSINIDGSRFYFGRNPFGDLEPLPGNPDPEVAEESSDQFDKLMRLLEKIRACVCAGAPTAQLPESQIFAATTTVDNHEIFTGTIKPDIRSLRMIIDDFDPISSPRLSIYNQADQHKFGSANYTLDGYEGGGDYIYIFDRDTYIPLPPRHKPGRLRALLKSGISYRILDTGER